MINDVAFNFNGKLNVHAINTKYFNANSYIRPYVNPFFLSFFGYISCSFLRCFYNCVCRRIINHVLDKLGNFPFVIPVKDNLEQFIKPFVFT